MKRMPIVIMGWISVITSFSALAAQPSVTYPIQEVPFNKVQVQSPFWAPRLTLNREVTIPHNIKQCEATGRIRNFFKAAHLLEGPHEGLPWDDSDVYKVMEGAFYSLAVYPDAKLESDLSGLMDAIVAAQEPDGYLYTPRTIDPQHLHEYCGSTRWSRAYSHETYCAGHFYEAAIAYYQATGKRNLLDVAVKNANLLCQVFGPGKGFFSTHPEIELALVKLYQCTGEQKYLDLAYYFLDNNRYYFGAGWDCDKLETERQYEPSHHAVAATYSYCGMTDIAALTGDVEYRRILDLVWKNEVSKKIYLTGGVGSKGEDFGDNYELPSSSKEAQNQTQPTIETCGAIANALWNIRLFHLYGDAQYLDVLERILYNGFLAGVSLDGRSFFYSNPLSNDGVTPFQGNLERQGWWGCACCPTNVVRFFPQIPGMIYAQRDAAVYVNLFIGSQTSLEINKQKIQITQETDYPWSGHIKIKLEPDNPVPFTLNIRIPGWARNQPLPGDLYRYLDNSPEEATLKLNTGPVPLKLDKGFAVIERQWQKGDVIELDLPMPVRRVACHEKVVNNAGKVALERGPVVYCAEWVDNGGKVFNLILPDEAPLTSQYRQDLLNGITVITGKALALAPNDQGQPVPQPQDFVAIPYYAWSNRGLGEMTVWLPRNAPDPKP